jgi:hypothetical protein
MTIDEVRQLLRSLSEELTPDVEPAAEFRVEEEQDAAEKEQA